MGAKSEKARQFWTVAPNLVWLLSSPQQPRDGRIHQPSSWCHYIAHRRLPQLVSLFQQPDATWTLCV